MKTVKCNYFGDNEYIMFNMSRLMEFEAAIGTTIGELLQTTSWPINTIITGYFIGMKQYKRNAQKYYELCDKLLSDENQDMSLLALQAPLMKALVASGVFGSKMYYNMFPEEMTEEDKLAVEEEGNAIKN